MKYFFTLFILLTLAACETPRAHIPMTMEQREEYRYPHNDIEVVYADEINELLEKYDEANAKELAGEEKPTQQDQIEGKSIKTLIRDAITENLRKFPPGTMNKKLRVIVQRAAIGSIAKTILVGNNESLYGIIQVLEPGTEDVIAEYEARYFENGGGGLAGLIVSAFTRRANVRLSEGLGRDIALILKTDVE